MAHAPAIEDRVHGTVMALLAQGCIPWRQPARPPGESHLNLLTGRPYRGADPILLDLAMVKRQASLPWWCTYAEARQAGLAPRRGAEGVHLGLVQAKGLDQQRREVVFHTSDLVGAKLQGLLIWRHRLVQASRPPRQVRLWKAERHLRAWPVAVRRGGHLPGYRRRDDLILLPRRQDCYGQEAFLATWARLQILSTGHPARLDRGKSIDQADDAEAFVGELAWTLLADRLGLARRHGEFALTASDWIARLRDGPETFLQLLAEAGKAAELLQPGKGDERMC